MRRNAIIVAVTALGIGALVVLNVPNTVQAQTDSVSFSGPQTDAADQPIAHAARRAGGKRLQTLAETLGLTDAQKAQVKPILKDAAQQTKAVRQDTSLSRTDRKAKIKSLRESMKSQLLPILTPGQQAEFAAMRHPHGHKGRKAAG